MASELRYQRLCSLQAIRLRRRLVTPGVFNISKLRRFADKPNRNVTALDVTDEAQVSSGVEAVLNYFGQIDVLVS